MIDAETLRKTLEAHRFRPDRQLAGPDLQRCSCLWVGLSFIRHQMLMIDTDQSRYAWLVNADDVDKRAGEGSVIRSFACKSLGAIFQWEFDDQWRTLDEDGELVTTANLPFPVKLIWKPGS